jgi:pilus assembly protein CpaF
VGLYERLAGVTADEVEGVPATAGPPSLPAGHDAMDDRLSEVRRRTHLALVRALGPRLHDTETSESQLEDQVRSKLSQVLSTESVPMSAAVRKQLIAQIMDDILGYGPLEPLLGDPTITEVMCNGPHRVFVERDGKVEPSQALFLDESHLRRLMDKIVGQVGRRLDEAQPYVDARLPDGSRVNAVIPPVAIDGPTLTIRKFASEAYTAADLIAFGTWTPRVAEFLAACVESRINILVAGGTGAGKTTTLNVLSSFIPPRERIVTIEDAAELRLAQPHVVRLEYRPPNIEGKGEITIRDLVRNSLRMRPDRIVVGEARGGEALDMLQAMNTGHDGSLTTMHANSPRDGLARLETMVLMAGVDLPVRAIREQIASGIQFLVQQARLKDGSRRITQVTEISGMEGDVVTLQDIFRFDTTMGFDTETGRAMGHLKPTGVRPRVTEHMRDLGVPVDHEWFTPEEFARRALR